MSFVIGFAYLRHADQYSITEICANDNDELLKGTIIQLSELVEMPLRGHVYSVFFRNIENRERCQK